MTKGKLGSLEYSDLLRIAEQNQINVVSGLDRESLVTLIFDALEEERLERESNNSLTIQVEAKKYTVSQDEELFVDFGEDAVLPERYGETILVLLLRDPSWVYCYWDVEDRILEEMKASSSSLVLRVSQLASNDWEQQTDWFDIPVQFGDLKRYINLPIENAFYGTELYAQNEDRFKLIVRSGVVESSRSRPADGENQYLMELSGLSTDTGQFPGTLRPDPENPHRIIFSDRK